jgi:hypothetical protein
VLIGTILSLSANYLFLPSTTFATQTTTWQGSDLALGSTADTFHDDVSDTITLALENPVTDTSVEDFRRGYTDPASIGTHAVSDDGAITLNQGWRYGVFTNPALASSYVYHSFLSGGLLYINTNSGLSVIDTNNTPDNPSDDTLVTRYHTGSTPALADNRVYHSFLADGFLYNSTDDDLSVIDTNNTPTNSADDTLVTRYYTGSTPAIANNTVYHSFLTDGLLYISTYGGGLSVIDTNNTPDNPSDDTLVTRYHTGSNPALADNGTYHSFLTNGLLYISAEEDGGLSVIDTNNTPDNPSDDTLVTRYYTGSTPALANNSLRHSFLTDDLLYVSTYEGGLSVIDTTGRYTSDTSYRSVPVSSTTPHTLLSAAHNAPLDTSISLSYRSGEADASWRDNFDTLDSLAGDIYGYNGEYDWQSVTTSSGVLRATGAPLVYPYNPYFVIETGYPDDYFAPGSVITLRYRVFNRPDVPMILETYVDDYESGIASNITTDEWQTIAFSSGSSFSNISIDVLTADDNSSVEDTVLEIDSLQITAADSMGKWDAWQSCADTARCAIDQSTLTGNDWLQYKLDLSTTDRSVTPSVTSVSWSDGYVSTGTYTSQTRTFTRPQALDTFTPTAATSSSTTLAYEYSLDRGTTWTSIAPGALFPPDTQADSFTWRATFTTIDPLYTPTLTGVSLSSTNARSVIYGTLLKDRRLADIGSLISLDTAETILRRDYPEYFENPTAPFARERAILVLLREVMRLLRILPSVSAPNQ